jgi:hypothetical protein
MKGEVTLFWQSNHIEVYSQARYDAEAEKNELTEQDYEDLSKFGI